MEREITIADCDLYQYYAKTLHLSHVLEIFAGRAIKSGVCNKAVFYFSDLCGQCKHKGGEGK